MSANYQEHHYRSLQRARDGMTNTIVSLQTAAGRMTGDDWIDAVDLLVQIESDIAPRLSRLRNAASDRFDEHTRLPNVEDMRAGTTPYPDERAVDTPPGPPVRATTASPPPPAGEFPSAAQGLALVHKHGSVDAAMRAYPPDSREFDCVQAYRYVSTGRRPAGWVPPIVGGREEGSPS